MRQKFYSDLMQKYPSSCAIKCQQIILRDYGINVSESELCEIALKYGWYDENGVYMHNNGKLLEGFSIPYHHSQHNSLEDIIDGIRKEHRIIVNVNRLKLEGCPIYSNVACHAVIVTFVDDSYVYTINTSTGLMNDRYNIKDFLFAWEDSCNYMLSTERPAIYWYALANG